MNSRGVRLLRSWRAWAVRAAMNNSQRRRVVLCGLRLSVERIVMSSFAGSTLQCCAPAMLCRLRIAALPPAWRLADARQMV